MQKALSELVSLPETELHRLVEREPLLVTQNGEPQFVAQSLDSFEAMVRRLREFEQTSKAREKRTAGKLVLLRS
jgi:PHD/YefM family antitoxin component YafN of YafNO toxin-antitoxin module